MGEAVGIIFLYGAWVVVAFIVVWAFVAMQRMGPQIEEEVPDHHPV